MKKTFPVLLITGLAGSMFFAGCSKDDTTPPNISLLGNNPMTISLNNTTATDPGATAEDDEDGSVNVTSDWSSTNPNVNLAGTYIITYTATDAAGNQAEETRTVIVKNDADYLNGNYSIVDTCFNGPTPLLPPYTYSQTITASTSINNRIHFNKFADYLYNTSIYATVTGNVIDLPSQTATGIGSLNESHTFSGTGAISGSNFVLYYTDVNNSAGGASSSCHAYYVKM